MRKPYNDPNSTFTETDLIAQEPLKQFTAWFELACQTPGINEANAVCLSTATKQAQDSSSSLYEFK